MVVERNVLINIVGRGFVWAKGFRKKKEGSFRTKGQRREGTRRRMPRWEGFRIIRIFTDVKWRWMWLLKTRTMAVIRPIVWRTLAVRPACRKGSWWTFVYFAS